MARLSNDLNFRKNIMPRSQSEVARERIHMSLNIKINQLTLLYYWPFSPSTGSSTHMRDDCGETSRHFCGLHTTFILSILQSVVEKCWDSRRCMTVCMGDERMAMSNYLMCIVQSIVEHLNFSPQQFVCSPLAGAMSKSKEIVHHINIIIVPHEELMWTRQKVLLLWLDQITYIHCGYYTKANIFPNPWWKSLTMDLHSCLMITCERDVRQQSGWVRAHTRQAESTHNAALALTWWRVCVRQCDDDLRIRIS